MPHAFRPGRHALYFREHGPILHCVVFEQVHQGGGPYYPGLDVVVRPDPTKVAGEFEAASLDVPEWLFFGEFPECGNPHLPPSSMVSSMEYTAGRETHCCKG